MLHKDSYVQNATHFCVLIFSPHFSPIWGECILAGLRIKYLGPISFHSPFLSQQNNTKSDLLSPFPLSSKSSQPNKVLEFETKINFLVKFMDENNTLMKKKFQTSLANVV